MIEAKPQNLIGDRAYDSDPLDVELRRDGIEMIAPHRSNRSKPATQDGRRLRRYARRWVVERFFDGFNGSVGSSSDGSITPRISSASSNSLAWLSSSGDFEIGSSDFSRLLVAIGSVGAEFISLGWHGFLQMLARQRPLKYYRRGCIEFVQY